MPTAPATINKKLNLVVPLYFDVEDPDEKPYAYVHSRPIDAEVFDKYFRVLRATWSQINTDGDLRYGGAQMAFRYLRVIAEAMPSKTPGVNFWEAPDGVEAGLVKEMLQRTNVLCIGANGWETVTFKTALDQSRITAEEAGEVQAALTFFTLASVMNRRSVAQMILTMCLRPWGASVTSLNATEYRNTLPTSTADENTGEKKPALSVAY